MWSRKVNKNVPPECESTESSVCGLDEDLMELNEKSFCTSNAAIKLEPEWSTKSDIEWLNSTALNIDEYTEVDQRFVSDPSIASTPCSPANVNHRSGMTREDPLSPNARATNSLTRHNSNASLFTVDDDASLFTVDESLDEQGTQDMIRYWEQKTTGSVGMDVDVPLSSSPTLELGEERSGEVQRLAKFFTDSSHPATLPPPRREVKASDSLNDWELYRHWEVNSYGQPPPFPITPTHASKYPLKPLSSSSSFSFTQTSLPRPSSLPSSPRHTPSSSSSVSASSSSLSSSLSSSFPSSSLPSSSASSSAVTVAPSFSPDPFSIAIAAAASGTTRLRPPPPPPGQESEEAPPDKPGEFERHRLKQMWEKKTLEDMKEQQRQMDIQVRIDQRRHMHNQKRQRSLQSMPGGGKSRSIPTRPMKHPNLHHDLDMTSLEQHVKKQQLQQQQRMEQQIKKEQQQHQQQQSKLLSQQMQQLRLPSRPRSVSMPSPVEVRDFWRKKCTNPQAEGEIEAPVPLTSPLSSQERRPSAGPVSELIKFWDTTIEELADQPEDDEKKFKQIAGSSLLCGPAQLAKKSAAYFAKRFRSGSRGERQINPKQYVRIMKRREQKRAYKESHVFVKAHNKQATRIRERGPNGRYLNVGTRSRAASVEAFSSYGRMDPLSPLDRPMSPTMVQSPSYGLTKAFAKLSSSVSVGPG